MSINSRCLALLLGLSASAFAVPGFVLGPALSRDAGNRWWVEFTVSESTDVAVSIVNLRDSTVVRHLAAGVLGGAAPSPLTKNDLHQRIEWDGRDDFGQAAVSTDSLSARVRAGMTTQLTGLVGGDPYSIGAYGGGYNFYGMVAGPDGSVYVAGMPATFHHEHYGQNFISIRKFDKDGNYVKTLFPEPSNLTQEQAAGWGVVNWPDGSYSPKNINTSLPILTSTIVGYMSHLFGSALQYMDGNGNIVFGSIHILPLKTDGSLPGNGAALSLVRSPAWPTPNPAYSMGGHAVLTPLRNGKLLMTGIFHYTGTMNVTTSVLFPDTNFWRDGKVFLLDPATGATGTWLSMDSVPQTAAERLARMQGNYNCTAFQGTARDSSDRIYVCERLRHRIGVYDTNAVLLGSMAVTAPHRVAVCGRTGAVYVVTQTQAAWWGASSNIIRIVKFAPFAQGGAPVCTLNLGSATLGRSAVSPVTSIAVNDIDGQVTLWIGVGGFGARLYRDNGASLTLVRDMGAESRAQNPLGPENPTPDRLVVDRRNENLFVSDSWYSFYKITDWSSPVLRPCSTSARKRLYALDLTISPDNNFLYMFEGQSYTGPVTRYTMDALHAPAPFANTGRNVLTPSVYSRWAPCTGVRGLAVATDRRVAVMGLLSDRATYYVGVYADSGSDSVSYGKTQVGSLSSLSGGVRFDLQGNLYAGSGAYRPSPFAVPDVFLSDTGFKWGVGSVYKFNNGDSGAVLSTGPVNAAKAYNLPLAPFSADRKGGCVCRSPRFDLDPYGRLFLPSAVTCQVSVADNEGNLIHQFGRYGNLDSRGSLPGLPTQEVIAGNGIPLAWPTSVAASEDYLYVSDYINYRIARVRMVYAADNMPGFSVHVSREQEDAYWRAPLFSLVSGPVPFSAATVVTVSLPDHANARLCVYDARGRLIRTLADRTLAPGLNRFAWDGRDAKGRSLAAGLYIFRFETGGRVLLAKTVLAK